MKPSPVRPFNPNKVPLPPGEQGLDIKAIRRPIDLEIGCGNGFHAISYASQNPDRSLIAIERTHTKFKHFQSRMQGHPHINNIYAVHSDAISWVSHYLKPATLSRVFLLYPNPYPKAKQANLRWVNMPFFQYLLACLEPGGLITLATNEAFYYEEARQMLRERWALEEVENRKILRDERPRTHFEKKYLERGEPCWNLIFRRPPFLRDLP